MTPSPLWEQEFNEMLGRGNPYSPVPYERIKDFISKLLHDQEKAFGGCTKCYGKGYGTQTLFSSSGAGDFEPAEPKTWKEPTMVFCTCERGKQLEKETSDLLHDQKEGFKQAIEILIVGNWEHPEHAINDVLNYIGRLPHDEDTTHE